MDIQEFHNSEARRKAVRNYLSKFKEIRVRVLPERHEEIVSHAKKMGDKSTVAFVERAIQETMDRDNKEQP